MGIDIPPLTDGATIAALILIFLFLLWGFGSDGYGDDDE